ncbi:MAG: hypothetical protein ACRC0R_01185, partial [Cetobacterium sp.]
IGGDTGATLLGAGIGAAAGALVGSVQDQTQTIKDVNAKPQYNNQYNQPQYNNQQNNKPYYSQPYTPSY